MTKNQTPAPQEGVVMVVQVSTDCYFELLHSSAWRTRETVKARRSDLY